MATAEWIEDRSQELFLKLQSDNYRRTDRLFAGLMTCQWLAGIAAAQWISPRTWSGVESSTHIHVWAALLLGGAITILPVFLAIRRPGKASTRHVIAVGQMLTSALFIHLLGGRIETHFHVFGSLAFLAFYRDWRVLISASVVVALDHFVRGIVWPQSVYGVAAYSQWRWLEHAGWVVFEDIFLFWSCFQGTTEMRETARRQVQLEASKEAAEAASRTKSEFLANMSHEIRTPLNGILGFADILHQSDFRLSDEERADHLDTIRSSGHHLLTLINDILDLSKIESGMLEVERATCAPHQVIAEVVSVLRVRAREKGLTLDYSWASGIPETILTDSVRLRQLLMNLVGNAIKFTETGGVRIVAKLIDASPPRLHIGVADSGVGIAAEKQQCIFEPFVQADNSVTRRFGGTGLGLPISRRLAEALGGEIVLESQVGIGSTFSVTIDTGPLDGVRIVEPAAMAADAGDMACWSAHSSSLPPVRILLVEDGATNRKLIGLIIERAGASVVTAEDGQAGVEAVAREHFDLILMDMQMPVMDGYTATRKVRASGFTGPIVALTAHAMKGDEERCRAAGCSGYLTKPIDGDVLLRTISEALTGTTADRREPASAFTIDHPEGALVSTLPTDDPEFAAIVAEFAASLSERLADLRAAWEAGDFSKVAVQAHWLKGAGGTVGFPAFTAPASELVQLAVARDRARCEAAMQRIEQLANRIVIPLWQPR